MDLEHHFTVAAPVEKAWAAMMDIESVAECFPGATVTSVEGDSFEGTVKVKLGPIALVYKGSGSFVERDDQAHRAVIDAKGKDKRGNGTAGALVTMTMTEDGGQTAVTVATDLNVTGKPAQFGRGVMQDVSDTLLGQFVDCLATKVGEPEQTAEPAAEPSVEPAGPAADAPSADTPTDTTAEPVPVMAAAPPPSSAAASASPAQSAAPSTGAPTTPTRPRGSDDALDLGTAVLPALARGYAPHVAIGILGLFLGWVIGRRGRR